MARVGAQVASLPQTTATPSTDPRSIPVWLTSFNVLIPNDRTLNLEIVTRTEQPEPSRAAWPRGPAPTLRGHGGNKTSRSRPSLADRVQFTRLLPVEPAYVVRVTAPPS
jgi:hypothetical protein